MRYTQAPLLLILTACHMLLGLGSVLLWECGVHAAAALQSRGQLQRQCWCASTRLLACLVHVVGGTSMLSIVSVRRAVRVHGRCCSAACHGGLWVLFALLCLLCFCSMPRAWAVRIALFEAQAYVCTSLRHVEQSLATVLLS